MAKIQISFDTSQTKNHLKLDSYIYNFNSFLYILTFIIKRQPKTPSSPNCYPRNAPKQLPR